jgi:Mn-dependent DtxR family transcriptional regulator
MFLAEKFIFGKEKTNFIFKREDKMVQNGKARNLTLEDWKILVVMYKSEDWKTHSFSTNEISTKIKENARRTKYKLNKLSNEEYIIKVNSYPIFWECKKDEKMRKIIEDEYKRVLKSLLGDLK